MDKKIIIIGAGNIASAQNVALEIAGKIISIHTFLITIRKADLNWEQTHF